LFHITPSVLNCHWYVKPAPVAITLKLVLLPAPTVESDGWLVMAGAMFTDNVAAEEVALGVHEPLTTQRYLL